MRKQLLLLVPSIVALGALAGCKGGNTPVEPTGDVKDMSISPVKTPIYVEDTIKSGGFNVIVSFSSGKICSVEDYGISPALPYTFTKDDAENGKEFTFTYKDFTKKVTFDVFEREYTKYCAFEKIDDNNVTVTKKAGVTLPKSITLPGTIDGDYVTDGTKGKTYNVTTVKKDAFKDEKGITKVLFSEGITTISTGSFTGCSALTRISVASSVSKIENNAFVAADTTESSLQYATFQDTDSRWTITDLKEATWSAVNDSEVNAIILHIYKDSTFTKNGNN